jgi:hypothetical protein
MARRRAASAMRPVSVTRSSQIGSRLGMDEQSASDGPDVASVQTARCDDRDDRRPGQVSAAPVTFHPLLPRRQAIAAC